MKTLVLVLSLILPNLASAYVCTGVDSVGGNVTIKVDIDRAQVAFVQVSDSSGSYDGISKVNYWSDSNMGHSRCPGTWGGFSVEDVGPESHLKSLSITTNEHFFGCGFAPNDTAVIELNGQVETIELACKE